MRVPPVRCAGAAHSLTHRGVTTSVSRQLPSLARRRRWCMRPDDEAGDGGGGDGDRQGDAEVVLHPLDVAEEVAGAEEDGHPEDRGEGGEGQVAVELHPGHAGDERHQRAHDGEEPAGDDGQAAVLLVELVRLLHVLRLQVLARLAQQVPADPAADQVVDDVAEEGRADEQRPEHGDVQHAGAGERAAGQQQGLAGQERRDHQAGLGEDGREDGRVGPQAERLDRLRQVGVEVEDVVEELVHAARPRPRAQAGGAGRPAPPVRPPAASAPPSPRPGTAAAPCTPCGSGRTAR